MVAMTVGALRVATRLFIAVALTLAFQGAYCETFDSDGVEIFYTVQGRGEPVVLIHGFAERAESRFGATGIAAALAADHEVLAIDLRGHGASGKPHDLPSYGEQMVRDVINLLDHRKIERAHVVGYSLGGWIAQKLVADYPERVIKGVIGGNGWVGEGANVPATNLRIAESLESGGGLGPLLVGIAPEGRSPSPEAIAAFNERAMAGNDPLALAAVARTLPEFRDVPREEMRAIRTPLLYVVGELDPRKPDAERAITVVSNSRLVTIPGASHENATSNPMFLQSVREFLAHD